MLFIAGTALAQTTLSGSVVDENNQAVPGVNIVLSSSEGTVSDFDGNFVIETNQTFPIKINVSAIGFASQQIELNDASALNIVLLGQTSQLEEIVVAASRRSERLAETPVSIERLNLQDIKNTTAQDFYQSLNNLKGVDVNMGSVTLPIINTRGFATFGNERFLQLVDGMDSAAPVFNFAVANLIGMSRSSKNLVLMGDQMQLGQPSQGVHPAESGLSILDYLLHERATIPADMGIFLDTTYRMHSKINSFISTNFYEERLICDERTDKRIIKFEKKSIIKKDGIHYIQMNHKNNVQTSIEEFDVVKDLMKQLIGVEFDDNGKKKKVNC